MNYILTIPNTFINKIISIFRFSYCCEGKDNQRQQQPIKNFKSCGMICCGINGNSSCWQYQQQWPHLSSTDLREEQLNQSSFIYRHTQNSSVRHITQTCFSWFDLPWVQKVFISADTLDFCVLHPIPIHCFVLSKQKPDQNINV